MVSFALTAAVNPERNSARAGRRGKSAIGGTSGSFWLPGFSTANAPVFGDASGTLVGQRFQNPCDGMRNARLKREDAFSHAMIIVISAMVSSS